MAVREPSRASSARHRTRNRTQYRALGERNGPRMADGLAATAAAAPTSRGSPANTGSRPAGIGRPHPLADSLGYPVPLPVLRRIRPRNPPPSPPRHALHHDRWRGSGLLPTRTRTGLPPRLVPIPQRTTHVPPGPHAYRPPATSSWHRVSRRRKSGPVWRGLIEIDPNHHLLMREFWTGWPSIKTTIHPFRHESASHPRS